MRYKTYVKKINDTLTKYKTDIDTLDSMYLADKEKRVYCYLMSVTVNILKNNIRLTGWLTAAPFD